MVRAQRHLYDKHMHTHLDSTTQASLFQIAKNLTAWKKIFNRTAVLNSKISKKRKIITDRNQLIEEETYCCFS